MKVVTILVIAFGLAAAQSPPKCEEMANKFAACPVSPGSFPIDQTKLTTIQKGCIESAAPKFGCKVPDLTCMCNNLPKIQAEAVGCVTKCAGADVPGLLTQAKSVCGCISGGGAKRKRDWFPM